MSVKKSNVQPLVVVPDSTPKSDIASEHGGICQKCYGTGLEFVEDRGVRKCSCVSRDGHSKLLDAARVPRRYEKCHFHSFNVLNKTHERALGYASKLSMDYPAVEQGLLLMGPVGVGKTHLAVSVLKGLVERGFTCMFYEFGGLLKEIQNSYNPISQTSEYGVLLPILSSDILVLDEIGATKPTDWVRDTLAYIINSRYNEKKLTIFTTNYLDNPANQHEETLEDRIGVRLRSRLFEMAKTITIDGNDYRKSLA